MLCWLQLRQPRRGPCCRVSFRMECPFLEKAAEKGAARVRQPTNTSQPGRHLKGIACTLLYSTSLMPVFRKEHERVVSAPPKNKVYCGFGKLKDQLRPCRMAALPGAGLPRSATTLHNGTCELSVQVRKRGGQPARCDGMGSTFFGLPRGQLLLQLACGGQPKRQPRDD